MDHSHPGSDITTRRSIWHSGEEKGVNSCAS
jgi:hypothetical protein